MVEDTDHNDDHSQEFPGDHASASPAKTSITYCKDCGEALSRSEGFDGITYYCPNCNTTRIAFTSRKDGSLIIPPAIPTSRSKQSVIKKPSFQSIVGDLFIGLIVLLAAILIIYITALAVNEKHNLF